MNVMSHSEDVHRVLWRDSLFWVVFSLVLSTSLSYAQCTSPDCTVCTAGQFICNSLANLPAKDDIASSVEEISFTGGTVSQIPAGYFSFPELSTLNLSGNALTTLPVDIFDLTNLLEIIDLTGNNIVCNDTILWLNQWRAVYADNKILGDCTMGGVSRPITDYLTNKSYEFAKIEFTDAALKVGRGCSGLATMTLSLKSAVSEDITYAIVIDPLGSNTVAGDITINPSEVTIPAGATSADFSFTINSGGAAGDKKEYLLFARPKLPITYESSTKLRFVDGSSCIVSVDVMVEPTVKPTTVRGATPTRPTTIEETTATTSPPPSTRTGIPETEAENVTPVTMTTMKPPPKTGPGAPETEAENVTPVTMTTMGPPLKTVPEFPVWLLVLICAVIVFAIVILLIVLFVYCKKNQII